MRSWVVIALAAAVAAAGCGSGVLKKQYEYEEELYLSLDGSATLSVNASVPALVALRGVDLNVSPRVRFFVGGRWRTGTAQALPDDDPFERQRSLPAFNARVVRLMGTELMTVRIDLDPE